MGLTRTGWMMSLRLCAALVAGLALSGCFISDEELVGYWAADRPMTEGVYAHTPTHPDGAEWDRPTWTGAVGVRRSRYRSDTPDFPHEGARFRQLHGDIYVVQIPRDDGVGYGVAFVYDEGRMVSYHQPSCSDFPEVARESVALALDGEGFCRISDLDQLEVVFRAYLDALEGAVRIDGVYRRVD